MKKKLGILTILSCISILFLYGAGTERIKAATEKEETETNIFQSVSIAKYDSNTKKASENLKDGDKVNYDELFQLEYHVVIPAESYKEADQAQDFSIEIPEFVPVAISEAQIVKNEQGDNLGSWKILDGSAGKKMLLFRTNEKFVESVDQEFEITFYASLNQSKMKNQNQELNLDFKTVKDPQISLKVDKSKDTSNKNNSTILEDNNFDNQALIEKPFDISDADSNLKVNDMARNGLSRDKNDSYTILIIGRDSLDYDIPVNGFFVLYESDDLSSPVGSAISYNGRAAFFDIPEGNYRVVGGRSRDELYYMPEDVNYVDITVPSANGDIKVYLNYLQGWGGIRLYKQDEETKKPLSGAEFKLVKYEEYEEPKVIKEGLVTNEAGVIQLEKLYAGEYAFIETKAPEGYVLDSTPVSVEIVPDLLVYPGYDIPMSWDTMNQATFGNELMKVTVDSTKLPENLDFGSHKIQFEQDETYTASDSTNAQTEGEIIINDTRDSGGWTLKVKQDTEFKHTDATNLSDNTSLTIDIGTVTNSNSKLPSSLASSVSLQPNDEKKIAIAQANEGSGKTVIPLDKFSLTVPKNASKKVGKYNSSLTWTLSDVPER